MQLAMDSTLKSKEMNTNEVCILASFLCPHHAGKIGLPCVRLSVHQVVGNMAHVFQINIIQ